jgi:hypothetical protein
MSPTDLPPGPDLIARAVLWLRARFSENPLDEERCVWAFRDNDPPERSEGVDHVDHELDLNAWRYHETATTHVDDPWAESEQRVEHSGYEVRRIDAGDWQIRQVGHNHVAFDEPRSWQPAPTSFVAAWEAAWQEKSSARRPEG